MIENDKEYQEAFEEFMKSKGVDVETRKYYLCEDLGCNNCILKDVRRDLDFCTFHPFEEIKRREKEIRMLKQQISIMSNWKKENKTLTKEELEGEKIYAEIQLLITKNGELTKEIARLYRKLDQMEKGEKKNG